MKNRLKIYGAGGQGKVIADIAQLNGYRDIVFLEKDDSATECLGFPVVKETEETAGMGKVLNHEYHIRKIPTFLQGFE